MAPPCSPFHKWRKQGAEQQGARVYEQVGFSGDFSRQAAGSSRLRVTHSHREVCRQTLGFYWPISLFKTKRTCFSALSRDITSSHKIWRGGNASPYSSPWDPQWLGGKAGLHPETPGTVSGEWAWSGFLWRCGFQRRSNGAHSAFPQIALSSWDLAEMSHGGKGIKVDKRTCFSPERTLPRGMAVISTAFGPIFPLWKDVECLYCGPTFQPSQNSALQTQGFCTHGLNQADWKYLEKIPESSKKQSLNLPHTRNYFPLYLLLFK